MRVRTPGRTPRPGRRRQAPLIAALATLLFLLGGASLLPLTGWTFSSGRGWLAFYVDAAAGPSPGAELTRVSDAYNIPGATFYEFRAGSWHWAAFVRK